MTIPWCFPWPTQSYWHDVSIRGLNIKVKAHTRALSPYGSPPPTIPPYLYEKGFRNRLSRLLSHSNKPRFPVYAGYSEAKELIGDGTVADLESLCLQARDLLTEIFDDVAAAAAIDGNSEEDVPIAPGKDESPSSSSLVSLGPGYRVVTLRLSPELEKWKLAQHIAGNILPPKGRGRRKASDDVLGLLGAEDWPEALQTNNALFGCGMSDLLQGGADAPTMFSNYVTDMAFYYEHGFSYIFPTLNQLYEKGLDDAHAHRTLGGRERREAVRAGMQYIQGKIALEKKHKAHLAWRSARLTRREAQIMSLSESSLLGQAAEAIARGFDPAAVMSDLVWASPGTDVLDVGCDMVNSEVMNSFLNAADIADSGVVSEDALRRVFDAYGAMGARTLTERWHEPLSRMCAALFAWHMQNDRHMFFRRALLGWSKARKTPANPQVEADFDEAFDKDYRTTGFSRPLDKRFACNGEETCDHVRDFLRRNQHEAPALGKLWHFLVVGPLEYFRAQQLDEQREYDLAEGSRLKMAELYARGSVLEMTWLMCHAHHHGWQVNYMSEAAMFGSILDGGQLIGKLDREDVEV